MITRGGYSNDYEGEYTLKITRGYSNDYDLRGEGTLMITRGGYSNDYEGMVL